LIFLNGRISAEAAVPRNQRIDPGIVDGANQKMQRITKQGLCIRRQFPRAHVSGEEQNSFAARLRRGEILKTIEQHDALDILLRISREVRKFRAHPAELPHHAAHDRASPLFVPFGKCQAQIFHRRAMQIGPRPKQKCRQTRSGKSRQRPRHRAYRFEQQPRRRVFQAISHPGIIAGAFNFYGQRLRKHLRRASLLKTRPCNARLSRLDSSAPIRSRAFDEGTIEISLWSVPLILVVLYVCLFSGLGALGLVGPDEPRYAAIARAMAETHDWVTPRLWGTPWFEKPVLYYWAAGTAMRIFGASEFAARLPSALGALLAVLAVGWTALRSYGIGTAWYSLLMLPTSVALIGFSRAATPDMLFAGMLTAAMAVAVEMLQKSLPGTVLRVAFGFFLGAAVLAKGPAAVILAGGATLVWAGLSRQWRASFRFLHPLVVMAFCATALPWYVLCALRNPGFLRDFIWHHNFERYLTPVFQHPQPFWFFGPILILGIFPWLPPFLASLSDAGRIRRPRAIGDSPALFMACWALFALLFFSFSQSKLPGYILPAIPPTVLLFAKNFARRIEQRSAGMQIVVASIGMVFPLLIGIAYARLKGGAVPPSWMDLHFSQGLQIEFAAALAGGILVGTFALRGKLHRAICSAALLTAALLLLANHLLVPKLDELVSTRSVALGIGRAYLTQPEKVAVFKLPRSAEYGLDYYFQTALPEWTPENAQAKLLFCSKQGLEQLSRFPQLENVPRARVTPDERIYTVDLSGAPSTGK